MLLTLYHKYSYCYFGVAWKSTLENRDIYRLFLKMIVPPNQNRFLTMGDEDMVVF